MDAADYKNILVIGYKGGLAQLITRMLISQYPNAQIVGIDNRDIKGLYPFRKVHCYSLNYSFGTFNNLFRNYQFDLVGKVGRLIYFSDEGQIRLARALDLHLFDFDHLLNLCIRNNIKKMIVLSGHFVYGAKLNNPLQIIEEYPVKSIYGTSPLQFLVKADLDSQKYIKDGNNGGMELVLLRPCNIVGPHVQNAFTKLLRSGICVLPIDYNPPLQFIDERDLAKAIVFATHGLPQGIYNLASSEAPIFLRDAVAHSVSYKLPIPISLMEKIGKYWHKLDNYYPLYLIDFLKFPCILDTEKISRYLPPNFFNYKAEESLDHALSYHLTR